MHAFEMNRKQIRFVCDLKWEEFDLMWYVCEVYVLFGLCKCL